MSGKQFFVRRYEALGWKYRKVEPKQAIRVNKTNVNKTDIVNRLETRGVSLEKIPFLSDGYWVRKSRFSVGATTEYLLGYFSVQEAAAQIPVTLFSDLRNKTVLDACAAPGGKTIQMTDAMHNTGGVVALDSDRHRVDALVNQLERCRVENAVVYVADARHAAKLDLKFDRILLDAPCSGNFVGDEEWFRRRTLKDVERNASVQKEMLTEAARILSENGELVYSTCSLEPEENELNIDWAVRDLGLSTVEIECFGDPGLTKIFDKRLDRSVERSRRIWPGPTQGFFVSKLKKEEYVS